MGRQLAPLFTIFTVKSGALSDIYLLTIFMTQGLLVFFYVQNMMAIIAWPSAT